MDLFDLGIQGELFGTGANSPVVSQPTVPAIPSPPLAVSSPSGTADTFLLAYTGTHKTAIAAASYVVFDLETTGLSKMSAPVAVGKSTKIGKKTWLQYQADFPGCTVDTRLRIRVVSLQLSDGSRMAFDLDALPDEDKNALLHDCVNGKVLIGHNLGFDLSWALHYTPTAVPDLILDTMVLARAYRPTLPARAHALAAGDNEHCKQMVVSNRGELVGVSLQACMVALGGSPMVKDYQKPVNWAVSHLSPEHYDYVMGDVDAPLTVLKGALLRGADDQSVQAAIAKMGDLGRAYSRAIYRLAKAHHLGLPLHMPTLQTLEQGCVTEIPARSSELVTVAPDFLPLKRALESSNSGVSGDLKAIWSDYAKRNGKTPPTNKDGELLINEDAATNAGFGDLPAWEPWLALQAAKKRLGMLGKLKERSKPDPSSTDWARIHPLTMIGTITLRTLSEEPNAQNIPNDAAFRSIFRARSGYSMLALDYGQIELRIAAALALRAIEEIRKNGASFSLPGWVRDAITMAQSKAVLVRPPDPMSLPEDRRGVLIWTEWNAYHLASAYRAVKNHGTPLAGAFQRGIDPHLLTGLEMAVRSGKKSLNGQTALDFLSSLAAADVKALKTELADERKSAKALNFGLLYGLGAEGLQRKMLVSYQISATLEDVTKARDAWFDMYPEIKLWQRWVKATKKDKNGHPMLLADEDGKLAVQDTRLYRVRTLTGREMIALKSIDALNYQDQGTGADMALTAVANLPESAARYFVNLIHDELLFEVPEDQVQVVGDAARKAMVDAGDDILGQYGIPVEVDPVVSDVWSKG